MDNYREFIGLVGLGVESVGVAVIVAGTVYGIWRFVAGIQTRSRSAYGALRRDLGRSILLGLEFLIAGDIIRTVAVALTLESVALLGLIILIRTFLSMALHVEVEGCWPWHNRDQNPESLR